MAYIVQTAAAKMPSSCKGEYRRVAVLEVKNGVKKASFISVISKDVKRVIRVWERLNVGTSDRCAYAVALKEAEALVEKLNDALIYDLRTADCGGWQASHGGVSGYGATKSEARANLARTIA